MAVATPLPAHTHTDTHWHAGCPAPCRLLQAMKAVGMTKPGPSLGKVMDAAMAWQLAHPQGSQAECEAHLVAHHSHLAQG